MKRKILILLICIILLTPIPTGVYKDGGTRTYTAITYKIVFWNRAIPNEILVYNEFIPNNKDNEETNDARYHKTSIFLFPNNFKSLETLWKMEKVE